MEEKELARYKEWFRGYVKSFSEMEGEDKNMLLKEKHTLNVVTDIAIIAEREGLSREDVILAESIALFHDVGRFPQYKKFRTFRDAISVNHAELSAQVIAGNGMLDPLNNSEREILLDAVKYHNTFQLPRLEDPRKLMFLKLIRDADKLDIWRVFIEFYGQEDEDRASAVGLGLKTGNCSSDLLPVIFEDRIISLSRIKTLEDYMLLQLSWVFGVNFRATFRLIIERKIISRILAYLPQTEKVEQAVRHIEEYVRKKAG